MASPSFAQLLKLAHVVRTGSKSLRARLMIWNACLVMVTAFACFLGVREGLRQALVGGMDNVLTADIREIGLDVAELHATAADVRSAANGKGKATQLLDTLNRKESVHEHNGWFVELLDADENRLWKSDLTPELPISEKTSRDMVPMSIKGYRVLESRQPTTQSRPLRIRVGAPTDFIERDVGSIDRIAIRGVVFLLIAAPLLGYWPRGGPSVRFPTSSKRRPVCDRTGWRNGLPSDKPTMNSIGSPPRSISFSTVHCGLPQPKQ